MKIFIKKRLTEMLFSEPSTEVGGRADIEIARKLKAKPYNEILGLVANDEGKDSDLYKALFDLYIQNENLDFKRLKEILMNYDVYDKYKHVFNLSETK